MALLERVTTLLRANLNSMLDRAEDPAKMLKQLLLDMDNQLLQVKTQVAIAIADQHVLEAKATEHQQAIASWRRKAQLALDKNDEPLARAALERSLQSEQLFAGYTQQLEDQRIETESLRENYKRLQTKLEETRAEGELLLAHYRRARNNTAPGKQPASARVLGTLKDAITHNEATKHAARTLASPNTVDDRFRSIERDERIEALLEELKASPKLLRGE